MRPDKAEPIPHRGDHAHRRMFHLKRRAVGEMKRFIVLFLYLWVLFGLFVLNERIVLRQHAIDFTAQGFAFINAFVLAKVMLVAEGLDLGRWLHRRPLIYSILHDGILFTALFIAFHVVEHVVISLIQGQSAEAGIPVIGGGGLAGLLCVAVILFVSLIPYFAVKHLGRALGPGQLKALVFGAPAGAGESENPKT